MKAKIKNKWKKMSKSQKFWFAIMLIGLVLTITSFMVKPYSGKYKDAIEFHNNCIEGCANYPQIYVNTTGNSSNWICDCIGFPAPRFPIFNNLSEAIEGGVI